MLELVSHTSSDRPRPPTLVPLMVLPLAGGAHFLPELALASPLSFPPSVLSPPTLICPMPSPVLTCLVPPPMLTCPTPLASCTYEYAFPHAPSPYLHASTEGAVIWA